jgi:DNA polymerase
MNLICLDFETYYDRDYSLSRLSTEEYVRDDRFRVHLVGWKSAEGRGWSNTVIPSLEGSAVIAHHAQFDGLILSHVYNVRPAFWIDTLSMSRILFPAEKHDLDSLSKLAGLPPKDFATLQMMLGVRYPTPGQLAGLSTYCLGDVENTWKLAHLMLPLIPRHELRLIDLTIRMFTEPSLRLDRPMLEAFYAETVAGKEAYLAALGVTRADLQSAERFAGLLRELGIEPPLKPSPTGNGDIYAFARTDDAMRSLAEHPDDHVQALVAARLGVKSTLNETRALRLRDMDRRGSLCVYLKHAAAHTLRWGGGDKVNWQNFPRGGAIRRSIRAPDGAKLVVADLSQIECRILNWLAGEDDVVHAFSVGLDIYAAMASRYYRRAITKESEPAERQLFKIIELACGYGMGPEKFRRVCALGSLGGAPIVMSDKDAEEAVEFYRDSHPNVRNLWYKGNEIVRYLHFRNATTWGPCEVRHGAIILPDGLPLMYRDIDTRDDGELYMRTGPDKWRKIYGAKLVENVVQALARSIIAQAILTIAEQRDRFRVVSTEHDSVVVLARGGDVKALPDILDVLRRVPPWAPGLPLDAEGYEGERYGR